MYGLHEYCWRCQQKYGKIFKVNRLVCHTMRLGALQMSTPQWW
jgi:hypothetical protein